MKDKEKQILAIAQDLSDCLEYDIENSGVVDTYDTAYRLVNKGWAKIPEGAMVIPEKITEETSAETLIKLAKYNEKVRTETAREILQELFVFFPKDKQFTTISRATILSLAKQYGVKVEE